MVTVKVIKVSAVQTVKTKDGREISKQDCNVGHVGGCVHVVLWENDIGALLQDMSYKLVAASVRVYGGVRYVSVGNDCEVVRVDGIGEVVDDDTADEEFCVVNYVVEGDIDGMYFDGIIGECGKCGMTSKMKKCIKCVTARVVVSGKDGKNHNLILFSDVIWSMMMREGKDDVDGDDVKQKLMQVEAMKFYVDNRDIVYLAKKL